MDLLFGRLCRTLAILGIAFVSSLAVAEETSPQGVPVSIGTCRQPDFFFLNISACPNDVADEQIPHCQFSASRYLADGRYHPSSVDTLIASLKPGVPVCFLIHGAFVPTELAASESPKHYTGIVHAGGNRPLHFVAVHWPSEINLCPCAPIQLGKLERRADAIGLCLAKFLTMIPPENPVCLLGHSYGTRTVANALHALSRGAIHDPLCPQANSRRRIRVVFTASTIDHHWLNPGERFGDALCRAECLLNFSNLLDPALKAYPLKDPLLHHPLGQNGFSWFDRRKLGWQAEKITERNVTRPVGCGHMIARYYTKPEVMNWMIPYIYFD